MIAFSLLEIISDKEMGIDFSISVCGIESTSFEGALFHFSKEEGSLFIDFFFLSQFISNE